MGDSDRGVTPTPFESLAEGWALLESRLAQRRDDGSPLRMWWRDDDMTRWTSQLASLLALVERCQVPIALATIPAALDAGLPAQLGEFRSLVTVLQHGYRHRNEAREGGRAVECGGRRDTGEILSDLGRGRSRLIEAFGDGFLPVMVPPWNRIEDRIAAALPDMGYVGLSVFGREGEGVRPGTTVANAHLDVLRWKGGARFAGEARILAEMLRWLDDQSPEASTSFGLLTHHLDHDEETWRFLERLVPLLTRFARPVSATSVFACGPQDE